MDMPTPKVHPMIVNHEWIDEARRTSEAPVQARGVYFQQEARVQREGVKAPFQDGAHEAPHEQEEGGDFPKEHKQHLKQEARIAAFEEKEQKEASIPHYHAEEKAPLERCAPYPPVAVPSPPILLSSLHTMDPQKTKSLAKVKAMYSIVRKDRSGAAIMKYLTDHAYAAMYGIPYGGICGNATNLPIHRQLMEFLGISDLFPLSCPPISNNKDAPKDYLMLHPSDDVRFPKDLYRLYNASEVYSENWIQYIRNRMNQSLLIKQRSHCENDSLRVAVHVRRGDVAPCHRWRYLPNMHYLNILDRYKQNNINFVATIYSESGKKYESLEDFQKRNYTLRLDGRISEVWNDMMQSDVIVMSKSEFAIIPATFGSAKVVYTPFFRAPLSDWEYVDPRILNISLAHAAKLFDRLCRKH